MNNFRYMLTEGPAVKKPNGGAGSSSSSSSAASKEPGRSKSDEFKEGVRDYKCSMMLKLGKQQWYN